MDATMGMAVDLNEPVGSAATSIKLPSGVGLELGDPLPVSLGDCTDAFSEIKALRLELEHKAEAVKKRENEIQEHIITSLKLANESGAVGKYFTSKIKPSRKPTIDDWNAFTAWIIKTSQTQYLYKRVNEKAVGEAEEIMKTDPSVTLPDGLGFRTEDKLSITKT